MWLSKNFFMHTIYASLTLAATLPNVTLPWGTWQANKLDQQNVLYTFNNIRFGAAPIGEARFNASTFPASVTNPEKAFRNNTYGPTCIQVDIHPSCVPPKPQVDSSEDCLFLDVYVPKSVWDAAQKGVANTQVIVWFYGGAYQFGAKDAFGPNTPFYTGDGIVNAAATLSDNVIFVAGNYRLGAFGWLAGSVMQSEGTPNAGLYDQRLVLEWVQKYIRLFGGDATRVTAWGESAGAGSIMHHLIQANGTRDPLFSTALLQSPAFQWQWDRSANGTIDNTFDRFAQLAHCESTDLTCLREATVEDLAAANQQLFDKNSAVGLFPIGPAIDDIWFTYLPAVALDKGLYWPGVKSLVVSHVANESGSFIPKNFSTPKDFDNFLNLFMPEPALSKVRDRIQAQYPAQGAPYYGDQRLRVAAVIQDSTFTCNTRQLYDAYNSSASVYMMQYSVGNTFGLAQHAYDLLPTFWNSAFNVSKFLMDYKCVSEGRAKIADGIIKNLAPEYQKYFADFAITGNPNGGSTQKDRDRPYWKTATATADGSLTQVLEVAAFPRFNVAYTDQINTHKICDFWTQAAYNVSKLVRKQRQGTAANLANAEGSRWSHLSKLSSLFSSQNVLSDADDDDEDDDLV